MMRLEGEGGGKGDVSACGALLASCLASVSWSCRRRLSLQLCIGGVDDLIIIEFCSKGKKSRLRRPDSLVGQRRRRTRSVQRCTPLCHDYARSAPTNDAQTRTDDLCKGREGHAPAAEGNPGVGLDEGAGGAVRDGPSSCSFVRGLGADIQRRR